MAYTSGGLPGRLLQPLVRGRWGGCRRTQGSRDGGRDGTETKREESEKVRKIKGHGHGRQQLPKFPYRGSRVAGRRDRPRERPRGQIAHTSTPRLPEPACSSPAWPQGRRDAAARKFAGWMAAARPPACAQRLNSQAAQGTAGALGSPSPPQRQLLRPSWAPSGGGGLLSHSPPPRAPSAGESPASHLCVTPSQTLVSAGPRPLPGIMLEQRFLPWGGKNRTPQILPPKPTWLEEKQGCSSSPVTGKNTDANTHPSDREKSKESDNTRCWRVWAETGTLMGCWGESNNWQQTSGKLFGKIM